MAVTKLKVFKIIRIPELKKKSQSIIGSPSNVMIMRSGYCIKSVTAACMLT